MTHSHPFSRASRQLHVNTSSCDWLTVFSMAFVIGLSCFFGFQSINVDVSCKTVKQLFTLLHHYPKLLISM